MNLQQQRAQHKSSQSSHPPQAGPESLRNPAWIKDEERKHRISSDVDGRLIIAPERNGSGDQKLKILEKIRDVLKFTDSDCHSLIFVFNKRMGNCVMLLDFLGNERRTKKDAITSDGAVRIDARTPISISVSLKLKGVRSREKQTNRYGPFEAANNMNCSIPMMISGSMDELTQLCTRNETSGLMKPRYNKHPIKRLYLSISAKGDPVSTLNSTP
ncbi:UNVERIFIED_CONTAM: hypothetical protein Slati_2436300 [Sesamum latifolium]|uniref:Uncharacterized protein n=1 Tax=Sesamum latifolium TaxID=2727402 RepID=A0AAW2WDZ0_9LAMI